MSYDTDMSHVEAFECYGAKVVSVAIDKDTMGHKTNATITILDNGLLGVGCASLMRVEAGRGFKWICGIAKQTRDEEVACPHLNPTYRNS